MAGNGPEDDTLNYIFLDVISCGLGGAILLGVILAVPKSPMPTAVASAPYLVVRAEVTRPDGKPDLDVLPNIWLQAPGHTDGFDLPLEQFDVRTGRVRPAAAIPQLANAGIPDSQVFLTGFFRHAGAKAEVITLADEAKSSFFELFITQPPAGQWTFKVRYQNRTDMDTYVTEAPQPIRVSLSVHVASTAISARNLARETDIKFMGFSSPVSVTIPGGSVKHVNRK